MADPTLTIAIPVYNRATLIERCLESVRAQDLRPLAIVIVDNGSTDGSPDVARRWAASCSSDPDLHVIIGSERRPGASAARAHATVLAATPLIYFLDSDDTLLPGAARDIVSRFAAYPEADIILAPSETVGTDGRIRTTGLRRGDLLLQHFHHSVLYTASMALRTASLQRAGGWNPTLRIWDDWELGLRLLLSGAVVRRGRRPWTRRYTTADSVTGDLYHHRAGHYPAVLAAARADILASAHRRKRQLLRLIHYRQVMLAGLYTRQGRPDLGRETLRDAMAGALADQQAGARRRLRVILPAVYAYIARGGRGAAAAATPLLR